MRVARLFFCDIDGNETSSGMREKGCMKWHAEEHGSRRQMELTAHV